jgi:ABC-2 type transport system ATP-binding protein
MRFSLMDDSIAIRTTNLTKTFGDNIAVDNFTLEVRKGELFGLVGPDGAGKTTIMRLLASVLRPTSGEAWVAGCSILKEEEEIKERIGYMSQRFGLYEDLTVMENITFYADLYEVPRKERTSRFDRLFSFSNLTPFKERLAGNLSGGMKQKLGLACALVHTPEVLFLDEPTGGVDPVSRRDFWRILYDLLKERITIFISTAYLDEAERCTRIGLIHRGNMLITDEPSRVKQTLGASMVEISTSQTRRARDFISSMPGVLWVNMYGDRLHIALEKRERASDIADQLRAKGFPVEGEREIIPSLEDVFISTVRKSEAGRQTG